MKARFLAIGFAILAVSLTLLPSGHAVPATGFTLDKPTYAPGDSGKATITFYNDQGRLIRITGVDMLFSYYYQDGRVYSQDFLSAVLSMNVTDATVSQPITVQFSLPNGIAAGYLTPTITVTYSNFNGPGFGGPNQDTSRAPSPLQIAIPSSQTMTYVLIATTILFAGLTFYFATRHFSSQATAHKRQTDQQG